MKMKNIAAVAMAGCMAASLAACGSSAASTDTAASSSAATAESTEATEATGASADGFTVQLGPNPETLDPALNAAVDGGNTLITIEEMCIRDRPWPVRRRTARPGAGAAGSRSRARGA